MVIVQLVTYELAIYGNCTVVTYELAVYGDCTVVTHLLAVCDDCTGSDPLCCRGYMVRFYCVITWITG